MDFEGDGVRADESLAYLLGTDEPPPTPSWNSRRSPHRLFETYRDRALYLLELLKACGAREGKGAQVGVFHLDEFPDLEFRIGGYKTDRKTPKQCQSVCPPAVGEDGVPRTWILGPETPVAELPDHVFAVLENLAERKAIESEPLLRQQHEDNGQAGAREPTSTRPPDMTDVEYVHTELDRYLKDFASAGEGYRHETLLRASLGAAGLVLAKVGLGEQEVLDGITPRNGKNCTLRVQRRGWRKTPSSAGPGNPAIPGHSASPQGMAEDSSFLPCLPVISEPKAPLGCGFRDGIRA
jgi:hypothetical protein